MAPLVEDVEAGRPVIDRVTEIDEGVQLAIVMTIEGSGAAKPACVATILIRQYV